MQSPKLPLASTVWLFALFGAILFGYWLASSVTDEQVLLEKEEERNAHMRAETASKLRTRAASLKVELEKQVGHAGISKQTEEILIAVESVHLGFYQRCNAIGALAKENRTECIPRLGNMLGKDGLTLSIIGAFASFKDPRALAYLLEYQDRTQSRRIHGMIRAELNLTIDELSLLLGE